LDSALYLLFLWDLTQNQEINVHSIASAEELQWFIFGLSVVITLFFSIQIGRYYKSMENVWEYIFWNERLFALLVIGKITFIDNIGLEIVLLVEIALAGLSILFHRNKEEKIFLYFLRFLLFCMVIITAVIIFGWIYEIKEIIDLILEWSLYFAGAYFGFFLVFLIQSKIKKKHKTARNNSNETTTP
jgi:hypothetical protein